MFPSISPSRERTAQNRTKLFCLGWPGLSRPVQFLAGKHRMCRTYDDNLRSRKICHSRETERINLLLTSIWLPPFNNILAVGQSIAAISSNNTRIGESPRPRFKQIWDVVTCIKSNYFTILDKIGEVAHFADQFCRRLCLYVFNRECDGSLN